VFRFWDCRLMSEDSGLRMGKSPVSRSSGWGGSPLDFPSPAGRVAQGKIRTPFAPKRG
jgi:hypothetical protein